MTIPFYKSLTFKDLFVCSFKETLSRKTLEFEGDLSVLVVLRVELSLYCLGSSYQIQTRM